MSAHRMDIEVFRLRYLEAITDLLQAPAMKTPAYERLSELLGEHRAFELLCSMHAIPNACLRCNEPCGSVEFCDRCHEVLCDSNGRIPLELVR